MRMILYLIFSLLLFSCSTAEQIEHDRQSKLEQLKQDKVDGVIDTYVNRDENYTNQYLTRLEARVGPNLYRIYDPVMEVLCYSLYNGGLECFTMSKATWHKKRKQEISEILDAEISQHSSN